MPEVQTLHQLFELQVERTPEAIALVVNDDEVSFAELNERANRLAHYLRSRGAGPEVRVAVMLPRVIEMVVSLLAILKSGAAYVPLDPQYPQERLEFMLADTDASILITQEDLADKLPPEQAERFCVDRDQSLLASQPVDDPVDAARADNLAYVIYTSGSTGRPKGVGIAHRNVVTFIRWTREVFSDAEFAGVLATTSICFDLSIFELFAPLSWGGTIILAENLLALSTLPAAERVTLINTVPSAMTEVVREGCLPESVRAVNLAGEALRNTLVQRIYEFASIKRVLNLYGPSEDTTYSTFAEIIKGSAGTPTIGRPITNTETYILDSDLKAASIAAAGELYIGGAGVARCYLNRPDLTATRFVPDPFSKRLGARLYRTGDRARYQQDGNIEFLGRVDHQVKLRGFRIELGEIEIALRDDSRVSDAIVLVVGRNGDERLVGYVVPRITVSNREIRTKLQQSLPAYMVPNVYVQLERFPLTANGKVDRQTLATIEPARATADESYLPARTPVEEVLAGMWRDVLGRDQIGVHDNFFELGGHSLKAAQLISRVRATFDFQMELRQILETPTVARLSEYLLKNETRPGQIALIAQLKTRVANMSAEEVRTLLRDKKRARG
jgi:amino acid adenylation domain-containing protein